MSSSNRASHLKTIADETIEAVRRGTLEDVVNRRMFPIKPFIANMVRGTQYYRADNRHLVQWKRPPRTSPNQSIQYVHIERLKMTTLEGCIYIRRIGPDPQGKIGVLNFASATRPGGGFRFGASAQEESLARSSTLFKALESDRMKEFYEKHKDEGQLGRDNFYSHAMIYSPEVLFFRSDDGGWITPYTADVLTCAAVNAKLVRASHAGWEPADKVEQWIEENMRERMGRILELFEYKGAKNLVLGSFGTGVFQNDVGMVARIWRELLYENGARFRFSFSSVLFAIPDRNTLQEFDKAFLHASQQSGSGQQVHGHGHRRS
ncbi:hypothetical protein DFP72DRAFT_945851 [Ephemerocybe angulata]|uniref:Microbial-type PARG catalytic domain-containing protein n=1 Tax=Ephemerocybe angulata TaxID=980116 RepID=A0A8H6H6F5_9AGAR|nr:hypothetical protein DFP72DRAFT_945851 [Tulosesus angulatus]